MLSIIITTHTGSVIRASKMVMWAQDTDPARLLCNAPYNTRLTHSITLFISINRHPWPITTKKLYNDPDSSWYRMSVFLHQNRPLVIFKRGSLYQYTPEEMVSGLMFLSEDVCHSVPSLWAGRQGSPVRASRALQMSAVFSQTEKEKRWPLTKDSCQSDGVLTLGSPMSSDGGDKCLANQHAMKSHAFPGLTPTREVTACADFQRAGSNAGSLPALSPGRSVSARCVSALRKAKANGMLLETNLGPEETEGKSCHCQSSHTETISDTVIYSELLHIDTEGGFISYRQLEMLLENQIQSHRLPHCRLPQTPSILTFPILATRGHFGATSWLSRLKIGLSSYKHWKGALGWSEIRKLD